MPRRVFPAGSVTNTERRPKALTFYRDASGRNQLTDLTFVSGTTVTEPVPRGTLITDDAGAYVSFAGPDDVSVIYVSADNGVTRTRLDATGDVADTSTYAPKYASIARRLLATGSKPGTETPISALAPTITLGTVNAAPTIASAVRIAPKRLSSTIIDTASDPHFDYPGAIPGFWQVSTTDLAYPTFLTGGSGQSARNVTRIRFVHTGSAFEYYFRARGTSHPYRIMVDGAYLTATFQSLTTVSTGRYYLKVDFGSSATREIVVEDADPEFGGVAVAVTDSITRPKAAPLLLAGFGDSHTAGANGVGRFDTWVRSAANILNAEWVNLGIGGSGFLQSAGAAPDYRTRLGDITGAAPDVLVLEGSWNDGASSAAAVGAEALFVYQSLKASLPNTLLVAAGPWVTSHTLGTALDSFDAALRTQAQAAGWHGYISYRDPLNLKATAPAWAATTAYVIGDVVTQNGFAQKCIVGHTSTGSFDQTKWRSTAIVCGTGKVGTTVGDGNADVIVSNDGVHNTLLGHQVKARHVAAELARIAEAIAYGATWAG